MADGSESACVVAHPDDTTPGYAVAIVTGGSCGVGREIALRLAGGGYAVVVVYVRDQGEAETAVEEILAANGTALAVRADVTDHLDVKRLFDETEAAYAAVHDDVDGTERGFRLIE